MSENPSMSSHLLIFGANGDLAMRKLYPALFRLFHDRPDAVGLIIGISRHDVSGSVFLETVYTNLRRYLQADELDDESWQRFRQKLCYLAVDVTSPTSFETVKQVIDQATVAPLVVYLATDPWLFGVISQNLKMAGIVNDATRVVLEKPIGEDLVSSQKINDQVAEVFTERRTYRIDHYLGKETVQNLLAVRFANALFEPLWNSSTIDHVQITVAESVGVEGRWSYYNRAGALRDMVQNHLLQLLCLVAMEPPISLDADAVRDEKIKVIRSLKPMTPQDVVEKTVRGQYTEGMVDGQHVPRYLDEGDGSASQTETFVALRADIDSWRWSGVPFYLRTGKRLPVRYSEIVIQFKQVPHSIFNSGPQPVNTMVPNSLIIRLQPEESIQLVMMNKVPGLDEVMRLCPVALNLSLSEAFHNPRTPFAHERLLLDVLRENQTLFMRRDEVEAAWQWIDSIQTGWLLAEDAPVGYSAGTWGPETAYDLIQRDGRTWND
ncbi:MAG: glucose-6-phosphate dehydrogenase [Oligoflexus sp.]